MLLLKILKNRKVLILLACVLLATYLLNRNVYTVTAYCSCKKCINSREFRDERFASNQKVYFGGIAANKSIPFGTKIKLIPKRARDKKAVDRYLRGRKDFIVEDRGFLIKGRKLDIFIPQNMGGHKTALKWGKRRLRIQITPPYDPIKNY